MGEFRRKSVRAAELGLHRGPGGVPQKVPVGQLRSGEHLHLFGSQRPRSAGGQSIRLMRNRLTESVGAWTCRSGT